MVFPDLEGPTEFLNQGGTSLFCAVDGFPTSASDILNLKTILSADLLYMELPSRAHIVRLRTPSAL